LSLTIILLMSSVAILGNMKPIGLHLRVFCDKNCLCYILGYICLPTSRSKKWDFWRKFWLFGQKRHFLRKCQETSGIYTNVKINFPGFFLALQPWNFFSTLTLPPEFLVVFSWCMSIVAHLYIAMKTFAFEALQPTLRT
jgi:hypothetical protein